MSYIFDLNVPRLILVNIEYFKLVVDLVNTMFFHPMTPP